MLRAEAASGWDDVLRGLPDGVWDIYHTEGFHRIYESAEFSPLAFVVSDGADTYLLPGMVSRNGDVTLFESAYGYGGPVSTSRDPRFIEVAGRAVDAAMRARGITRGRLRFHPVLDNYELVDASWQVSYSRSTAGIDLTRSAEEILDVMHGKHRNAISRAQRLGLEFRWDDDLAQLDSFMELYDATMDRLGADPAYYYGEAYYSAFRRHLGGSSALGLVLADGVVVSAALFMRQGRFGHYHLSGSTEDAPTGAGQLLIYGAALKLKSLGVDTLHLGGGVTVDPDDTLLRFKRRFGDLRFDYHVGVWPTE